MTQFWRLIKPAESDYRSTFVNGEVRCSHELPTIFCPTCSRKLLGYRVLPVECPESWRTRREVTPSPGRWLTVSPAEFEALRDELAPAVGVLPPPLGALQRGDRFQPLRLRVPSRPDADFLWPGV